MSIEAQSKATQHKTNQTNIVCPLSMANGFKCGHDDWIQLLTWLAIDAKYQKFIRQMQFEERSNW